MRKELFGIVLGIAAIGFLYDVVSWARDGNHGVADVLWQYWWAVLFIVSWVLQLVVRRSRRPRAS